MILIIAEANRPDRIEFNKHIAHIKSSANEKYRIYVTFYPFFWINRHKLFHLILNNFLFLSNNYFLNDENLNLFLLSVIVVTGD